LYPATDEDVTPIDIGFRVRDIAGGTMNNSHRIVLCSNGNIYGTWIAIMGNAYGDPFTRDKTAVDVNLHAKPFLFYPLNGGTSGVTWYDADNERFMSTGSSIDASSTQIADKEGDPFLYNQQSTGRTLIYGENTWNTDGGSTNGNSFALMRKASDDSSFIYKFYAVSPFAKRNVYEVQNTATGFKDAKFYAFASTRTLLFYVYNNTLYAYDYNPGNERLVAIPNVEPGEITMLRFDTQIEPKVDALYIATYNASTGGTLKKYKLGTDPNTVELIPVPRAEWSGLMKVANMSWRATE
jgi:hypothetical protein